MKQRSNAYWDRRAQQRMAEYHRDADETIRTVTRAYKRAQADIQLEIDQIFRTFSAGAGAGLDPAKARRYLNQKIPSPLLKLAKKWYPKVQDERIKRWLLARMNAPAYSARITRLQALKEQVALQCKLIADVEITTSRSGYLKTIRQGYYRSVFDLQRGLGLGFNFAQMPVRDIEEILRNPWSGKHFSARVWDNTELLANTLTEIVTSGLMSGASNVKLTKALSDQMQVGQFAAARVIRTETTYVANAAELVAYREAEVEEYQFMATLDSRTSPTCRQHDSKVYKVAEARPGVNLPPLHPWCRSTTRAWLGGEAKDRIQRRARDPVTGETMLVPGILSYEDWYKEHVIGKHGPATVEQAELRRRNSAADQRQFAEYKELLGKDAPRSLAKFQDLKYTGGENWRLVQLDYSRRSRLAADPALALPHADSAVAADEKFTKYLFNPEHKQGAPKGAAFTSRLGYDSGNWKELQQEIRRRAALYPAKLKQSDQFGSRFEQKVVIYGKKGTPANVVVGWNVVDGQAKMTSVYIKEVKKTDED